MNAPALRQPATHQALPPLLALLSDLDCCAVTPTDLQAEHLCAALLADVASNVVNVSNLSTAHQSLASRRLGICLEPSQLERFCQPQFDVFVYDDCGRTTVVIGRVDVPLSLPAASAHLRVRLLAWRMRDFSETSLERRVATPAAL